LQFLAIYQGQIRYITEESQWVTNFSGPTIESVHDVLDILVSDLGKVITLGKVLIHRLLSRMATLAATASHRGGFDQITLAVEALGEATHCRYKRRFRYELCAMCC